MDSRRNVEKERDRVPIAAYMKQPKGFFGVLKTTTHIISLNPKHFCCISGVIFLVLALQTALAPAPDTTPSWTRFFNTTSLIAQQAASNSSHAAGGPDAQPLPPFHPAPSLFFQFVLFYLEIVVVVPPLSIILCRSFLNKNVDLKAEFFRFIPKSFIGILLTTVCVIGFVCAAVLIVILMTVITVLIFFLFSQTERATLLAIFVLAAFWIPVLLYLTIIWHLAYIVTVLEETWGWDAMRRSAFLLKGHKVVAFWLILLVQFGQNFLPIHTSKRASIFSRFSISAISLVVLTFLSLYDLSTRVVLYITCKLYHNEPIEALTAASGHRGDEQTASKYTKLGAAFELESSIQDVEG